ncbi:MAG: winged helix-turn-helix transcriptional regulator [Solirubrobacteraceae bacterium]
MRTYGQYCAIAKALDLIGDRWTLLVVRELLLRGACRYTDLRNSLPGIATNLLAERLRDLEGAGIVSREEARPPVATTLFRLTSRGEELAPVLRELLRWGAPLMQEGPTTGDVFRGHWITWPAEMSLTDREPDTPPVTIQVLADGEPAVVKTSDGGVHVTAGRADDPDAVLRGPAHTILGLLTGNIDLDLAATMGADYEGDRGALERVLPDAATV